MRGNGLRLHQRGVNILFFKFDIDKFSLYYADEDRQSAKQHIAFISP